MRPPPVPSWSRQSGRSRAVEPFDVKSLFVGCLRRLDCPQAFDVEHFGTVEAVETIALLEDIGQLGVAVTKDLRVVEQRAHQALEAFENWLWGRPSALAPRLFSRCRLPTQSLPVPPDAAEFATEIRPPGVWHRHGPAIVPVDVPSAVGRPVHQRP